MLQAIAVPRSLAEAHAALAEAGAALVAGGTAVMPVLNLGTDAFTRLVSLRRAGLDGIAVEGGTATVGAATPLAALEAHPDLAFLAPALDAIASPTVRNMATVGGNLFVKPPYGDLAACLVALDATAVVSAGGKRRSVPVEALVKSGVGPGEIVVEIAFPLPADGTLPVRQGRPQGAEQRRGGDGGGGRRGRRRQGGRLPDRAGRRRAVAGARRVGRECARRQAARPGHGGGCRRARRCRHRAGGRRLCQRLVPPAGDAGPHPPRPSRRMTSRHRHPKRQR